MIPKTVPVTPRARKGPKGPKGATTTGVRSLGHDVSFYAADRDPSGMGADAMWDAWFGLLLESTRAETSLEAMLQLGTAQTDYARYPSVKLPVIMFSARDTFASMTQSQR